MANDQGTGSLFNSRDFSLGQVISGNLGDLKLQIYTEAKTVKLKTT